MGTITIKNLIGGSINIVTGGGGTSERWVEPVYRNEWVFSNGKKFDEEYVIFPDDNGTSFLAMREIYNGDPSNMSDSFYVYADKGCTQ